MIHALNHACKSPGCPQAEIIPVRRDFVSDPGRTNQVPIGKGREDANTLSASALRELSAPNHTVSTPWKSMLLHQLAFVWSDVKVSCV